MPKDVAGEPAPQVPARSISVSWDEFHRDARQLAARLANEDPFDIIVGIARGGLVPATIVARELGVRFIETVCVASYQHAQQGEARLIKGPTQDVMANADGGKRVLIVDDLVDTGRTARLVRGLLPQAHYAVVYAKPLGRPLVDTFVAEVPQDTWIDFPWDTALAFRPPLREEGM